MLYSQHFTFQWKLLVLAIFWTVCWSHKYNNWLQIRLTSNKAILIQVRTSSQTKGLEGSWNLGRDAKSTFSPLFTRPTGVRLAWDSYPTIYRFNVPVTILSGIDGSIQSTNGHIQRRKSACRHASFVNMAATFFPSCDNSEATTWKQQLGSDNSECDNVEDSCQVVKTWIWTRVFSKKVILTS